MADGIYAIALAMPARRNTTEFNKNELTRSNFTHDFCNKLSHVSKTKKLIKNSI